MSSSPRTCAFCEREHDGSYWWARYCSKECRYAHEMGEISCPIGGTAKRIPAQVTPTTPVAAPIKAAPGLFNRLKLSEPPIEAANDVPDAKLPDRPYARLKEGERRLTKDGYVSIRSDGEIKAEHRVVLERVIGRLLRKGESVHHRNGIRSDNRPENLELWVGPVRYGQRATDVLCPSCGASYAEAVGLAEAGLGL